MSEPADPRTRVQSVFDELLDRRPFGDPWLEALWDLAARTRPGQAAKKPADLGTLLIEEAPSDRAARTGTVYDRALAPPAAFLRFLLEHPEQMTVTEPDTFGARNEGVRAWRRRLFADDPSEVSAAQSEGLRQLASRLAQRGRNKWWLFEGFTRVSACFATENCVLLLHDRPEDLLAPSTRWFPGRNQLWRNVEAARELAAGRKFGVILAVDSGDAGRAVLADAEATMADSYPHLVFEEQEKLGRHLLGFVTWPDVTAIGG